MNEVNKKFNLGDDLNIEKNRNLIFIYCPPKVGSTSLVSSIRLYATTKFSVIHVHGETMLNVLYNIHNITINQVIEYNRSLGKNVYVIDIYRSPIEQQMSLYFEELASIHFNTTEEHINKMNPLNLIKRFNNIFPHIGTTDYFKNVYNIGHDYSSPFDFSKKYILKDINGIKYIKLRLKDSDTEWSRILKELLHTNINIVKDYETDNKIIKEAYATFKKNYMIPSNLFHLIKSDKSLQYYYSEQERNEYINSWENKVTLDVISYTKIEYALYKSISYENIGYNVFQSNHYMDTGCTCRACNYKRNNIIHKIKNGETNTEKIIHNVVKAEYLQNIKIPQFKKKVNQIIMQQKILNVKRSGISKTIMKL